MMTREGRLQRSRMVVGITLWLTACHGGPSSTDSMTMETAEELVRVGRLEEAVAEYDSLYHRLVQAKPEAENRFKIAVIFDKLFILGAASFSEKVQDRAPHLISFLLDSRGIPLLSMAVSLYQSVLSEDIQEERKRVAAGRLAEIFHQKALRPDLRKTLPGDTEFESFRETYRGLILDEIALSYELFRCGRLKPVPKEFALSLFQTLSEGYAHLAQQVGKHRSLSSMWEETAKQYVERSVAIQESEEPGEIETQVRKFVEYDAGRHLQEGANEVNRAVQERASRGDPREVVRNYHAALLHFVCAGEAFTEPSPAQADALETCASVFEFLRLMVEEK